MWPSEERDWMGVPEHIRGSIRRYVVDGIKPGDFLSAVICNDLGESFMRADDTNVRNMHWIVSFFYNHVPDPAWGSPDVMKEWMEKGGLQGLTDKAADDIEKL